MRSWTPERAWLPISSQLQRWLRRDVALLSKDSMQAVTIVQRRLLEEFQGHSLVAIDVSNLEVESQE